MTSIELLEHVISGDLIVVGEYRGCRAASHRFVDPHTGDALGSIRIIHLLECGQRGAMRRALLTEVAPKGADTDELSARYTRGRRYVFFVTSLKEKEDEVSGWVADRSAELLDA